MPWYPNIPAAAGSTLTYVFLDGPRSAPSPERSTELSRGGFGETGRPLWVLFRQGPMGEIPQRFEEDAAGYIELKFRIFGERTENWGFLLYKPTDGRVFVTDATRQPFARGSGVEETWLAAAARELQRYRLPNVPVPVPHPLHQVEDTARALSVPPRP